jgi:hypothetical protein
MALTTLRGTKFMVKTLSKALVALVLGASLSPVIACNGPQSQRTEQMTVHFERDSSALASDSILRLANWSAEKKVKYPLRLWTSVVGMAASDEKNARSLAAKRANNVKNITDLFGISSTASEVKSYVNSRQEVEMTGDGGAIVLIDMNPGCPDDCCDGITHPIPPDGEPSGLPAMTR